MIKISTAGYVSMIRWSVTVFGHYRMFFSPYAPTVCVPKPHSTQLTAHSFFPNAPKGHKEKCNLSCQICPRSYHLKCINNNPAYTQLESFTLLNDKSTFIKDDWVCFECEIIAKAESDEGRSACMRRITKEQFCELLSHALVSIKKTADVSYQQLCSSRTMSIRVTNHFLFSPKRKGHISYTC